MKHNMLGEMRLLEYFKSERNRLLTDFATDQGPPDFEAVKGLAIFQSAIQATEALILEGGFKEIAGEKPSSPFWASSADNITPRQVSKKFQPGNAPLHYRNSDSNK